MAESLDEVDGNALASDAIPAPTGIESELTRLTVYADAQERRVSELQTTISELQAALDSGVVSERAIGMLAERFDLGILDAFELLRTAARVGGRDVVALAREITESRESTPTEITDALQGQAPA